MQFGSGILGGEPPVDGGLCRIALGLISVDGSLLLIAVTARICTLYGDFSGRSDSRFRCFGSPATGVGSGPDYLAV